MKQYIYRYGIICGLVYVVLSMVSNLLGISQGGSSGMGILMWILSFGLSFLVIFLGIKAFRDDVNSGYLTMGEAFKLGMGIALIAALITAAFVLLYNNVIDPEAVDKAIAAQREAMEDRGMDDEAIDQAMSMTGFMRNPAILIAMTVFIQLIGGLIKSVISGAVLQNKPAMT